MTVYLGDHGFVELKRASGAPIRVTVGIADVNVEKRRFSFPEDVQGELITGDQVDILRVATSGSSDFSRVARLTCLGDSTTFDRGEVTNASNQEYCRDLDAPRSSFQQQSTTEYANAGVDVGTLNFIDGSNADDWRGFVHIDIMGGIRLYDNFEASIRGNKNEAIELSEISEPHHLLIQTRNSRYRCLAQVRQFEFTTERETIDITVLTDDFRKRYEAGLISGQGRLDCFWDHKNELCDPDGLYDTGAELPIYLAQLCIRLVQGADFLGRFFIYSAANDDPRTSENSVWYEAECIVTNVSITVSPTEVIEASIDFVTTGQIKLLVGVAPSYLLKEDTDKLLQEDGSSLFLAGAD